MFWKFGPHLTPRENADHEAYLLPEENRKAGLRAQFFNKESAIRTQVP